jgi:2-oxoglutarate/2-oxoacid ferredoxin oxidoreductase subunit beta
MTALVDEQRIEKLPGSASPKVRPRTTAEIARYLAAPKTIWCPGCSNGTVLRAIIDAVLNLEANPDVALDLDKVVVVAGIGCCGRIVQYIDFSTVHTTHGRALAVATGVKLADPSLHVLVVMGDGDCMAIGGNHLIHAARRNLDLTAIVFNNSIYGMTGGQMSPTTFEGDISTTSVYGNIEQAFDTCELARSAGATFVARGTSYRYAPLANLLAAGIAHKGFSFVEAMVACPTYYGRQNKSGNPARMLARQKERSVPAKEFDTDGARLRERYPVGILHHVEREEYATAYEGVIERAQLG